MPTQPSAKVIADSISNDTDTRLTTLEIVMHRYVLAEFNTHRVFSRNSASSRAIPVEKQIKRVLEDPALPLSWGKNQKGMQAEEELDLSTALLAKLKWYEARDNAVKYATELMHLGVHKQITNRLLEPFLWHTAIVSSTEWDNFLIQRDSTGAQPEIAVLAKVIREALINSTPNVLSYGEYHLPYIMWDEKDLDLDLQKLVSVARCARVSYMTHEGVRDTYIDIALFTKLKHATPPHKSPFEHVATPESPKELLGVSYTHKGNFSNWKQFRHEAFES